MTRTFRSSQIALAALLSLVACNAAGDEGHNPAEPAGSVAAATGSTVSPTHDGIDDGYPDLTPAPLTGEAAKGETGARNVLLSFARAIELEEFDQAYAMLGNAPKQTMTRAQFVALFDGFGTITVAVPGGRMEGTAGSLYYEVPIAIGGTGGQRLEGTTVLRRANDVPGATAEQLRWHIRKFDVAPVG